MIIMMIMMMTMMVVVVVIKRFEKAVTQTILRRRAVGGVRVWVLVGCAVPNGGINEIKWLNNLNVVYVNGPAPPRSLCV